MDTKGENIYWTFRSFITLINYIHICIVYCSLYLYLFVFKKSNGGKDSTSLSKLAVVGKKIRGFKIYFVNFLLLHQLSGFVEGFVFVLYIVCSKEVEKNRAATDGSTDRLTEKKILQRSYARKIYRICRDLFLFAQKEFDV